MSYYSATNSGNNTGFGGNTGSAGYGGQGGNSFQKSQQQPQQNTGFSNNVSQWQAQPQTQQQPMQQQQQQQQQQTPQPFFAPSNVQQAVAQQAFQQGVNEVMRRFDVTDVGIPGLNYVMTVLRSYFAVDNHYVKRKMLRVLFPFLKKEWRRLVRSFDSFLFCFCFELATDVSAASIFIHGCEVDGHPFENTPCLHRFWPLTLLTPLFSSRVIIR